MSSINQYIIKNEIIKPKRVLGVKTRKRDIILSSLFITLIYIFSVVFVWPYDFSWCFGFIPFSFFLIHYLSLCSKKVFLSLFYKFDFWFIVFNVLVFLLSSGALNMATNDYKDYEWAHLISVIIWSMMSLIVGSLLTMFDAIIEFHFKVHILVTFNVIILTLLMKVIILDDEGENICVIRCFNLKNKIILSLLVILSQTIRFLYDIKSNPQVSVIIRGDLEYDQFQNIIYNGSIIMDKFCVSEPVIVHSQRLYLFIGSSVVVLMSYILSVQIHLLWTMPVTLIATLTSLISFLSYSSKQVMKDLHFKFEVYYLYLNSVVYCVIRLINFFSNSEFYSKDFPNKPSFYIDVIFWQVIFLVFCFCVINIDSITSIKVKCVSLFLGVSNIIFIIIITSQNHTKQTKNCLLGCVDLDNLSIHFLLVLGVFCLKYLLISIFGYFQDRNYLLILKMKFLI